MTSEEIGYVESDDYLHPVSDNFYENETFWFSFFVPERNIGAWIYVGVRQNAGITHGGLWLWDDTAVEPWALPFYESFSALKLPTFDGAPTDQPNRRNDRRGGAEYGVQPPLQRPQAYRRRAVVPRTRTTRSASPRNSPLFGGIALRPDRPSHWARDSRW